MSSPKAVPLALKPVFAVARRLELRGKDAQKAQILNATQQVIETADLKPLLTLTTDLYARRQSGLADELLDAIQETASSLGVVLAPEFIRN